MRPSARVEEEADARGGQPIRARRILRRAERVRAAVLDRWACHATTDADGIRAEIGRIRLRVNESEVGRCDVLPDVYGLVCRAAHLVLGLRMRPEQIDLGILLDAGAIVELANGSGKTLASVMPLVLRACSGQRVHFATANDYLAQKAVHELGPLYECLGLRATAALDGDGVTERATAYSGDVVYSTVSTLGLDYLRDNLRRSPTEYTFPGFGFLVVDEVDWCLLDQGRTPLIVSAPSGPGAEDALRMGMWLTSRMAPGDHFLPLSGHLTFHGIEYLRNACRDYPPDTAGLLTRYARSCLIASQSYKENEDYVVDGSRIILIDDASGRRMPGHALAWPLWAALHLRHNLDIPGPSHSLASTTTQNFIMLYGRENVAGMTGTAVSDRAEYEAMFGLPVVKADLAEPMRHDRPDIIYKTAEARLRGVVIEIIRQHEAGGPILAVTPNVETSNLLSSRLCADAVMKLVRVMMLQYRLPRAAGLGRDERDLVMARLRAPLEQLSAETLQLLETRINPEPGPPSAEDAAELLQIKSPSYASSAIEGGIRHLLANAVTVASYAEEEELLADAGRWGAVTISTMLFGRGADILLGGCSAQSLHDAEAAAERGEPPFPDCVEGLRVRAAGGLMVIGYERSDLPRTDAHIRGRAGRMRAPGQSVFFVSLDDALVQPFRRRTTDALTAGWPDEEPLESAWVTRGLDNAQTRVNAVNREQRLRTVSFDAVKACHRRVFYAVRKQVLEGVSGDAAAALLVQNAVKAAVDAAWAQGIRQPAERWDDIRAALVSIVRLDVLEQLPPLTRRDSADAVVDRVSHAIVGAWQRSVPDPELRVCLTRDWVLRSMDAGWQAYLQDLDDIENDARARAVLGQESFDWFWREAERRFRDLWHGIECSFTATISDADVTTVAAAEEGQADEPDP